MHRLVYSHFGCNAASHATELGKWKDQVGYDRAIGMRYCHVRDSDGKTTLFQYSHCDNITSRYEHLKYHVDVVIPCMALGDSDLTPGLP